MVFKRKLMEIINTITTRRMHIQEINYSVQEKIIIIVMYL